MAKQTGETVLLYHIEGEKGRKLKALLVQNGIRIRSVKPEQYGQPIGFLAGVKGIEPWEGTYQGEDFPEEMMVLKGIFCRRLDMLLGLMRREGISIGLKAVVTEQNMLWDSVKLYEEIREEHEAMTQG